MLLSARTGENIEEFREWLGGLSALAGRGSAVSAPA
jgi:hypothetical protein